MQLPVCLCTYGQYTLKTGLLLRKQEQKKHQSRHRQTESVLSFFRLFPKRPAARLQGCQWSCVIDSVISQVPAVKGLWTSDDQSNHNTSFHLSFLSSRNWRLEATRLGLIWQCHAMPIPKDRVVVPITLATQPTWAFSLLDLACSGKVRRLIGRRYLVRFSHLEGCVLSGNKE